MTHDELLEHINKDIDQGGFASACGEWFPARSLLALRAVVELHIPYAPPFVDIDLSKGGGTCFHCSVDIKENSLAIPYPCPTIEAIEKELG